MLITSFTIASDFQSITVGLDAEVGNTVTGLEFWYGENYLNANPVDLSGSLSSQQIETLTFTRTELGIEDDTIQGILTINATGSNAARAEQSILNSFYDSLAIARKVATADLQPGSLQLHEIEILYFLLETTKIYISSDLTEQALNVYTRLVAMLTNYPDYMVTEDVPECLTGAGCWIINGKYIIH